MGVVVPVTPAAAPSKTWSDNVDDDDDEESCPPPAVAAAVAAAAVAVAVAAVAWLAGVGCVWRSTVLRRMTGMAVLPITCSDDKVVIGWLLVG